MCQVLKGYVGSWPKLTADETMITWQGVFKTTQSYLAYKPHPLNFKIKTLACSVSIFILEIDLVKGVEKDASKTYNG